MPIPRRAACTPLLLSAALLACGGNAVEPSGTHRIVILAGGGVTDTVGAELVVPLSVAVRDANDRPLVAATVRFTPSVIARGGTYPAQQPGVWLARAGEQPGPRNFVADTTDSLGRCGVIVRMGQLAGDAAVVIAVPSTGDTATVHYTVRPGTPVRLDVQPSDTALVLGSKYQARVILLDYYQNPIAHPTAQFTVRSGPIAASSSGEVSASTYGRGAIVVASEGLLDTLQVSVVPQGTIAAERLRRSSVDVPSLVVLHTDGSLVQNVYTALDGNWSDLAPTWSPDGSRLTFQSGLHDPVLYSTTLQGAWYRLIPTFDGLQSEFRAQYSRDGAWIYFTGRPDHQNGEIWRVAPDGSGAARVGPAASWYDVDTQPSPSPDGTRVAFATNRTDFSTLYLRILDLATGSVFDPNVRGQLPRWSPQGDRIAYYDESEGGIKVMNPDGSQQRFVAFIGYPSNTALDWSPDGQWLIVGADGLVIVNVATGELLPIAGTTDFGRPSWHP